MIRRAWSAVLGPSGWRSVIGPLAFALLSIALLVYDHLNQRVPALVFWLTLGLIVTVCVRMLETNRRQSRELAPRGNRAAEGKGGGGEGGGGGGGGGGGSGRGGGGERQGGEAGGRRGGRGGGGVARWPAGGCQGGGGGGSRSSSDRGGGDGEVVLAATGPQDEEPEVVTGRSYGEVTIPGEASDADTAFQVAGRRLAAHRQRGGGGGAGPWGWGGRGGGGGGGSRGALGRGATGLAPGGWPRAGVE